MMWWRDRLHRNVGRGEDGSMLLALLATIVIGGLALTLVATTMSGQRKVRNDRDHQLAINGADAGVQHAATVISQLDDETDELSSEDENATTVGDVDYEWTAERDTIISWRIYASGTRGGVTRHVEALATRDATFYLAAFADVGLTMRGNNEVRSYSSTETDTGNGAVGSNGAIRINGNSSHADLIMLMGDNATCDGNICDDRPLQGFSESFDMDVLGEKIREQRDAACGGSNLGSYDASRDGELDPGTYCFSDVTLDKRDAWELADEASGEDPVRIYLDGDLDISGHAQVNCQDGCDVNNLPDSRSLQIYSLGDWVSIGNHAEVVAAIAAPHANCGGSGGGSGNGGSNAQADIYGAIICNDLSNQGGWDFHFDERLLDLGSGQFEIAEWREEVGGTSTFDAIDENLAG